MDDIDPEIKAMSEAGKAISALENEEARSRVIKWLLGKFVSSKFTDKDESPAQEAQRSEVSDTGELKFEVFVDLFDRINPTTAVYKVITAGYWIQIVKSNDSWTSFAVNDLLKNAGQGVKSISHVIDSAQSRKPALVRQLMKSGKSKQSRKTYKLTEAGIDMVIGMIGSSKGES